MLILTDQMIPYLEAPPQLSKKDSYRLAEQLLCTKCIY